jgi:hypothetical protein
MSTFFVKCLLFEELSISLFKCSSAEQVKTTLFDIININKRIGINQLNFFIWFPPYEDNTLSYPIKVIAFLYFLNSNNEGTVDRVIRVILGFILIYTGAIQMGLSGVLAYIVLLIGLILLISGIIGYCGLYTVIGINTLKKKAD